MPDFPDDLRHVWGWFLDLNARRSVGMSANPISYGEIDAYSRVHGISMLTWEVELICSLDNAILAVTRSGQKTKSSDQLKNETPASDGHGVASLLRGFKRKPKASR
ncbi:phage tail assembly chaperone [Brucella intermedia]